MTDTTREAEGPLRRVLREAGDPTILRLLGERLAGADLTTLLLEVFRLRAGRLTPTDVLRRYRTDRFVAPARIPFDRLRRAEDILLSAIREDFEVLTLSPVAPLGTHSVIATVDQNKVISTIRASELAADPTNGLALEAARLRRAELDRDSRSVTAVRLAAIQRVVRAQRFAGAASFAHFGLFGIISAGRDTGSFAFERHHSAEHLRLVAAAMRRAGARHIQIRLTILDPRFAPVGEAIKEAVSAAEVLDDQERSSGHGYYTGLCYKVWASFDDEMSELADGGFVDWTQELLGNRKERLLISGVGIDRLATNM